MKNLVPCHERRLGECSNNYGKYHYTPHPADDSNIREPNAYTDGPDVIEPQYVIQEQIR